MIPCIGDVWSVDLGGKQNLVLILGTRDSTKSYWGGYVIQYLILKGNGEGERDWHRLEEKNRWRWRKVTD